MSCNLGSQPVFDSLHTMLLKPQNLQVTHFCRHRYRAFGLNPNTELERYADKYRPSPATRPTLKKKDLHQPFFPPEVFEGYFNPKKKAKGWPIYRSRTVRLIKRRRGPKGVFNESQFGRFQ